jgi:hypothetical protein
MMLFAALHESAAGPKPPIRDVRFTAVIRGIAEVTLTSQNRRN